MHSLDDVSGPDEKAITADLLRRERAGERARLDVGPWSAYMLVAGLQSAAHLFPATDRRVAALQAVSRPLEALLAGTEATALIEAGWAQVENRERLS